jgi:hypothetical protein
MNVSEYTTQSADISVDMERRWFERLRAMEPWDKLRMVGEMWRASQELALAGMRTRYPQASERELRLRLAATRLDRETMLRAFGWDPLAHA